MPGIQSTRNTTNQALLSYQCPVPLRATPSVSKSGSFTLYGSGQGITLGSILAVSEFYGRGTVSYTHLTLPTKA